MADKNTRQTQWGKTQAQGETRAMKLKLPYFVIRL